MHAGKVYTIREVAMWTTRETVVFIIIATVPTVLHELLGWTFLSLPWLPIALIGTAVAFLIGFKNNASYDRLWEARKIWGGIVNTSRTFSVNVLGYVRDDSVHKTLIYRHLAWLTALRFQLRQPRAWENTIVASDEKLRQLVTIPEEASNVRTELLRILPADEVEQVLKAPNPATQLLTNQALELRRLADWRK